MKSLLPYAPPIIAHRGVSALAPENTLFALQKAADLGIKWVEFDVMLAACGEVVVIHDETLERTTNGKGLVKEHSYADLKQLDAGSWFAPEFANARIPTLAQVIDVLQQQKLAANIEIKPSLGCEEMTVQRVLEVLKKYWQSTMPLPLISSFSSKVLQHIRKHSTSHCLAYLMHTWQSDWQSYCDDLNCIAVDVNHTILDMQRVKEIKSTQRFLLSYTVDEIKRAQELFSWGVDAVFSNYPLHADFT